MLKNSPLDYLAVYGNNDAHLMQHHDEYKLVQEPYYFKLADLKFKLMHLPFYMAPDADVVIFGHTHHFECEYKGDTLFLNSGEVCGRKKPTLECAMLDTSKKEFTITQYARPDGSTEFQTKTHNFKRK